MKKLKAEDTETNSEFIDPLALEKAAIEGTKETTTSREETTQTT
jgi:hypothetical protein